MQNLYRSPEILHVPFYSKQDGMPTIRCLPLRKEKAKHPNIIDDPLHE